MNRYFKTLLSLLALAAVLTLTHGQAVTPVEASSAMDAAACIGCGACVAACPPNSPMCQLACNNAWWACNDACAAAHS